MEIYDTFFGFVRILKESYKIFSKNGKLIPSITLLFLFLSSIFLLSNIFSIKPYITDFVVNLTSMLLTPSSSDFANLITPMKYDLRIFAGIEWLFVFANTAASLLFATAAILSSSAKYVGKNEYLLDLKGLLSWIGKTWKRPFITLFYTTLLDLGYVFFVLAFLVPFVLTFGHELLGNLSVFSISIIALLAALFYLYLAIVWTLAMVVSVLEEKSGIQALGRAEQLVEGMKIKGFLLKLVFGALYYVLLQLLRITTSGKKSTATIVCIWLLVVNSVCFVKMFSLTVFTIFYYECKKTHGEEVSETQGRVEYNKAASDMPLIINSNIR
ncbi:Transmembrane protein [Trema orientale]|uniref:Transmembrane protein n=1 Tax=Trema orientale TaxID=63057 RepID=A0A2P5FZS7_TREOI|nr:Transmembrane protein [Trema orientale]